MAAEATGAAAIAPRSGPGGLQPWQALSPAQPGQASLPQPPDWHQERPRKRTILLQGLGTFHVVIATLHVVFGTNLVSAANSLHLVVLKSWYPFWGAASFLFTGMSMIAMEAVPKTSLKVSCLVTHSISIFCVPAGLIVLSNDLFLGNPFESVVRRLLDPNLIKDNLPLVPDMSLGFSGPPPSYEDVIQSDAQEEQRQR
ncbi:membrane-spanning 4-domains subfamily A member 10 isoform X2 [Sturnira hondurensis]|uniref:membrane-spanning 4-domains subfamily A member 10 isoform X2 n=1 Tax=Sturnira hondurensis TaxID=192404 RepID=UPI00187A2DDE|nr:membrane-spanning 4-domains subfamily A member 10 isoform X2 [Sturnira hondurensis]